MIFAVYYHSVINPRRMRERVTFHHHVHTHKSQVYSFTHFYPLITLLPSHSVLLFSGLGGLYIKYYLAYIVCNHIPKRAIMKLDLT